SATSALGSMRISGRLRTRPAERRRSIRCWRGSMRGSARASDAGSRLFGQWRAAEWFQNRRVDDVNGLALAVRQNLIEHIRELNLVLVPRHVADVRGTDDVVHHDQ